MREILKRLSCLSLIAFLGVSGLFINKTNASTEDARVNYFAWSIYNFEELSFEEQENFVNICNARFRGDFTNKYFKVIEPFLGKLGLEHLIDMVYRNYILLRYKYYNTLTLTDQVFKWNVEMLVLRDSFIELNPWNLYVRVIIALINGTELS